MGLYILEVVIRARAILAVVISKTRAIGYQQGYNLEKGL